MAEHQSDYGSFFYTVSTDIQSCTHGRRDRSEWTVLSDGNGAGNDAILQHHTEDQEDKVEQEHGGAQNFVHLPLAGSDGDDDEEKHDEEQHDGTEEAVAADGDRRHTMEGGVEEPRHRKP